jgi:hypothetical protein
MNVCWCLELCGDSGINSLTPCVNLSWILCYLVNMSITKGTCWINKKYAQSLWNVPNVAHIKWACSKKRSHSITCTTDLRAMSQPSLNWRLLLVHREDTKVIIIVIHRSEGALIIINFRLLCRTNVERIFNWMHQLCHTAWWNTMWHNGQCSF